MNTLKLIFRKIGIIVAAAICCAAITMTSCKDGNTEKQNNTEKNNGDKLCSLSTSITPCAGWEKNQAMSSWQHEEPSGSITLTCSYIPSTVKSAEEFVEWYQEKNKKTFPAAEFGPVSKIKVDGKDALECIWLEPSINFKYRDIYIYLPSGAYIIQCGAFGKSFDALAGDFQTMINSYKLN